MNQSNTYNLNKSLEHLMKEIYYILKDIYLGYKDYYSKIGEIGQKRKESFKKV